MEFTDPIRPGDIISASAKIISIETKASGETMTVELLASNQSGQRVNKTLFSAFIRGGRNRDAVRAESGAERFVEPARGEPDFTVAQKIDDDQTYRYAEASGDRNPIHVDAGIAKMAGLPGIIVHGLCTMAFTSKVAIEKLCSGDPTRLKRLRVRFSRPVLPGQTITTKIWPDPETPDRKTFTFDATRRIVRWKGRRVFKAESGEIPFDDIVDIGTEAENASSQSGGREVPIYRLTIITPQATIPMAYAYSGHEDRYSALRRQILEFVKPGSTIQSPLSPAAR